MQCSVAPPQCNRLGVHGIQAMAHGGREFQRNMAHMPVSAHAVSRSTDVFGRLGPPACAWWRCKDMEWSVKRATA